MNLPQDIKILQVDNSDLVGRIFNGHDLQVSLNKMGYHACQAVKYKYGNEQTTSVIGKNATDYLDRYLFNLERELSMSCLLNVWDRYLEASEQFQTADIVHYHKVHAGIMSLTRFPKLVEQKASIWTLHDPWAFTGHCVHPLECGRWEDGCGNCPNLKDYLFPLKQDKSAQLWNIKKNSYENMDIDIVVSTVFMENFLRRSPLTNHFKRVHMIPFGVKEELTHQLDKQEIRNEWNVSEKDFLIGFRNEDYEIKGCKFIYEALERLDDQRIVVVTVGGGKLPDVIKKKFRSIEFGWQNDEIMLSRFYSACDLFLMPSLAESFGMMAIEAMASGCTVIVFKGTVLEDLVFAPECGIAVEYRNSTSIERVITALLNNPMELRIRGEKSRKIALEKYSYKDYVRKHIELYEEVYSRKLKIKEVSR